MSAPERIWIDPGAWEIVGMKTKVEPEYDVPYIRLDAHEAAIAASRKDGWNAAIEAVKTEIKEWLALPSVPPKNPRAEVYDEACHNIMQFVCDLKPAAEAPQ